MPHEIQVVNLQDEEVVSHSLVIVRGVVKSRHERHVTGEITARIGTEYTQGRVVGGSFKLLLELQPGNNVVLLQFDEAETSLRLQLAARDTDKLVLPVYIVCSDEEGHFQGPPGCDVSVSSAKQRIVLATRLLQAVIAEKLWEAGVTRRTFAFSEYTGCHVHKSGVSSAQARAMSEEQLWEHFARELVTEWGIQRAANFKFLAFLACTRYSTGFKS